jgi:Fur family ferric uptake transcriptional regulator
VNQLAIRRSFEAFLKKRAQKLTLQRQRIFERAFATHEHFSADRLYAWLQAEQGPAVSRATVYRTLSLLVAGGFLASFDPGGGELVYEHVLGHRHHDHMVCLECGRIEEFLEPRIEELQRAVCQRKGFDLSHHSMRLFGTCHACARRGARTVRSRSSAAPGSG